MYFSFLTPIYKNYITCFVTFQDQILKFYLEKQMNNGKIKQGSQK